MNRWILIDGDRKHVAGVLLLGVLVALLLLSVVWPIEYRSLLEETTMVQNVFITLLSGVILLVSIVVAVASVGVSQELTSIGDQSEQVDSAIKFRNEIEDREGVEVSPARPGEFLAVVLEIVRRRAEALDELAAESSNAEFQEAIEDLTNDIYTDTDELFTELERIEPGSTGELLVGLDYDCSWQLHQVQRIRAHYGADLPDGDEEPFEDLEEILKSFLIGRDYFKTLYFEREFAELSIVLLTVSLPIIVVITYVLLALDAGLFPDITFLGFSPITVFISFAYTIALAPFIVLTAYVYRAATITKQSPATGPFIVDEEWTLTIDENEITR